MFPLIGDAMLSCRTGLAAGSSGEVGAVVCAPAGRGELGKGIAGATRLSRLSKDRANSVVAPGPGRIIPAFVAGSDGMSMLMHDGGGINASLGDEMTEDDG